MTALTISGGSMPDQCPATLTLARVDMADRCLDALGQQLLDICIAPAARRETVRHVSDLARTVMTFIKSIRYTFELRREASAEAAKAGRNEAFRRKRAEKKKARDTREAPPAFPAEHPAASSLDKATKDLNTLKKNLKNTASGS